MPGFSKPSLFTFSGLDPVDGVKSMPCVQPICIKDVCSWLNMSGWGNPQNINGPRAGPFNYLAAYQKFKKPSPLQVGPRWYVN